MYVLSIVTDAMWKLSRSAESCFNGHLILHFCAANLDLNLRTVLTIPLMVCGDDAGKTIEETIASSA